MEKKGFFVSTLLSCVSRETKSVFFESLSDFEKFGVSHRISRLSFGQLPDAEKERLKNVRAFIGGECEKNTRKVLNRTVLALDADKACVDFHTLVEAGIKFDCCMHSTISHTRAKPRYRLIVPLQYPISTEVFPSFSKKFVSHFFPKIERMFDTSSHRASQIMYFPVRFLDDAEYFFRCYEGYGVLDPESILKILARKKAYYGENRKSKQCAYERAFIEKYDVPSAISRFLPEKYLDTGQKDRYKYYEASSTAGAVLYDDGEYLYSFHESDPANDRLCNSFHLVRIHQYGHLDGANSSKKNWRVLPSYQAMCEYVKTGLQLDLSEDATFSFRRPPEITFDPMYTFVDKKTGIQRPELTLRNFQILLENLGIIIRYNMLTKRIEINIPDVDSSDFAFCADSLRSKLRDYRFSKIRECFDECVHLVAKNNVYHPVREYLSGLDFSRVDGDVYSEFQKLADSLVVSRRYSEEMKCLLLRRWLISCVEAAYTETGFAMPGMLILACKQGVNYGEKWLRSIFSNTIDCVLTRHKMAREQLKRGLSIFETLSYWIVEMTDSVELFMQQLAALRGDMVKTCDIDSKTHYRYARRTVFCGIVDGYECLPCSDAFFRPIPCEKIDFSYPVDCEKLWGEVMHMYQSGERSELSDVEKMKLSEFNCLYVCLDVINTAVLASFRWKVKERYWMTLADIYNNIRNNRNLSAVGIQKVLQNRKIRTKCDTEKNNLVYYAMPPSVDLYFSGVDYTRVSEVDFGKKNQSGQLIELKSPETR